MKRILTLLILMSIAGCMQTSTPSVSDSIVILKPEQSTPSVSDSIVILKPEQSTLAPSAGTLYQIGSNPMLYETHKPGPKEEGSSTAWWLANEFVIRTALRTQCELPADRVIPHKIGYMVFFKNKSGTGTTRVFVRSDMKTIELK